MKSKLFILLFASFFLTQCDKTEVQDDILGTWNLKSVTGGFAGVDCTYEVGDITWSFEMGKVFIENTLVDGTICSAVVSSDTIPYFLLKIGSDTYLNMGDSETGHILIEDDQLTLDQNNLSTGTGADGFVMTFNR